MPLSHAAVITLTTAAFIILTTLALVTSTLSYRQYLGQPVFPIAHQLHSGHHLAGCISATARTQLLAPRMYQPSDRSYPETVDTSPPWLPWLSNLAANCTHKHLAQCLAAAAVKNVSGCSTPVILFSTSSSGIKFAGNSFSISNVCNSSNSRNI